MKTFFMCILVGMILFSVFGPKLKYITEDVLKDILSLKKDISSLGIDSEIKNMNSAELQEMVAQKYLEQGSLKNLPQELDPEVKEILSQIREEQVMIVNPIVQKLLDMGKSEEEQEIISNPKKYFITIIQRIEPLNNPVGIGLFIISAIIFFLVFITYGNNLSGFGLCIAKFGFIISRFCIFFGAITASFLWISLKYNIFDTMSYIFLWGPLAVMIFSAISLKVYDFNSPIWNRMFLSTIWPIVSGLIIHAA